MKRETQWMAVVVNGPMRQHLLYGVTPSGMKREVWAKALGVYQQAFREDPNDPNDRAGYEQLLRDWQSGRVRAVKVEIRWENVR